METLLALFRGVVHVHFLKLCFFILSDTGSCGFFFFLYSKSIEWNWKISLNVFTVSLKAQKQKGCFWFLSGALWQTRQHYEQLTSMEVKAQTWENGHTVLIVFSYVSVQTDFKLLTYWFFQVPRKIRGLKDYVQYSKRNKAEFLGFSWNSTKGRIFAEESQNWQAADN